MHRKKYTTQIRFCFRDRVCCYVVTNAIVEGHVFPHTHTYTYTVHIAERVLDDRGRLDFISVEIPEKAKSFGKVFSGQMHDDGNNRVL